MEKDWFKDRGYPHFSGRTPAKRKSRILKYISDPTNVAQHSFYPLLLKNISQRRYKLSDFGNYEKRSHKTLSKEGIITSNKKIREILYATHIDAHLYSYYAQEVLSVKYEDFLKSKTHISTAVSAYRQIPTFCETKFKNNAHFAKDVFDEIKQRGHCVALAFDIENFFPSLDHKLLKLVWAKILGCKALPPDHYNIFKAVTNFSYVRLEDLKLKNKHFDEKALSKLKRTSGGTFYSSFHDFLDSKIIIHKNQKKKDGKIVGIPQGLPISALLANIYMLPFDEAIIDELSLKHNIFYRRYSDDIVVICQENQIELVKDFIENEIEKIKLVISLPKTETTVFKQDEGRLQSFRAINGQLKKNVPMTYLGFEFYGYQVLLKSKNLAAFYREMKETVRRRFNQIEKRNIKLLQDNKILHKRKIYRLYTFKGQKSRLLPAKRTEFINNRFIVKKFKRKYRGNYIRYVVRAAEEMNSPQIKKQIRNHWKILQETITKQSIK